MLNSSVHIFFNKPRPTTKTGTLNATFHCNYYIDKQIGVNIIISYLALYPRQQPWFNRDLDPTCNKYCDLIGQIGVSIFIKNLVSSIKNHVSSIKNLVKFFAYG